MSHDYQREREVAVRAVREAAVVCARVQAQVTPEALEKKDRSPVTVADFASQAVVCRAIGDAFPHDPNIAEEDAAFLMRPENEVFLQRVQAEVGEIAEAATADRVCEWIDRGTASEFSSRFWTLDPIDGTKGFLRGEQYAVSLALIVDGKIRVAAVGCPNLPVDAEEGQRGCLFAAVRGQGTELYPIESDETPGRAVRVTATRDPSLARFCESVESGHSSHGHSQLVAQLLGIARPPVRLDSQAKYAVVARGEADVYLRLPTRKDYREKIWDHAGGALIVEEAGGRVTDIHGEPLDFTHGCELTRNQGVVVTNGILHPQVVSAVQQVLGSTKASRTANDG